VATKSTESDRPFQLAVAGGAALLAAILFAVRFCSGVPMPAKPPAPSVSQASANELIASADSTPIAYKNYVESDASAAGVPVPTMADMARKLPYRVDESHHGLEPGDPPLEVAGLRLSVIAAAGENGRDLILVIENPGDHDLAYDVVTKPSYGTRTCNGRDILPLNAMVVPRKGVVRRSECLWRGGEVLGIDRVETLELSQLEAYYVSRVPPTAVGIELRLAQGHRPLLPMGVQVCNVVMSQSIRAGLESGAVTWRDLIDFYARHRCDTYHFPEGYRAFRKDGERPLPAVSPGE